MNTKIAIIGYGEIGSALSQVYKENNYETKIYDPQLGYLEDILESDILNICIPYSDNFVEIVNNYIDTYRPKMTVIHSTVAPGTTKLIKGRVCHSPVRGLHPNLKDGIKIFLKYIGSENIEDAEQYSNHLSILGIKSHICKNSITSEYAKLLDTTYYGLCIAFHSEVNDICSKNNIDFEEVMTLFNSTYNQGYSLLGKSNFIRPVLYPTQKIGGHCIVPNVKILKQYSESKVFDIILKYE